MLKGSIKNRLTLIIMIVTITTSFVGYSTFLYWFMNNQHQRFLDKAQTVGLILGQDIAKLILLKNVSIASDITTKLKSFKKLESMVLFNNDKKPIFQYSKKGESFSVKKFEKIKKKEGISNENGIVILIIDAIYEDKKLGYIQLNFKVETPFNIIKKDLEVIILMFLLMMFFSYFLANFFAIKFTNPILGLVKFLEKIDHLSFLYERVHTKESNEYGKLYNEINKMLERIESSHKALKIASVAFETQSGMIITDNKHKILQVNNAFTKITGYSKSESIGKTPAILKSGLHDDAFYNSMYDRIKKDNIWIGEINNKTKSGTIVTEHLIIQAVLDERDNVQYYVASFLDITKQKLIESKLTEKDKILIQQSKMAQMGEMLENIAHQWRQPLSVITTFASGIRMQMEYGMLDNTNLDESLNNITISANHLSQTIEDFREFYKDNKIIEEFSLSQALEETLALIKSKFKNQDIEIIKNYNDVKFKGYKNELIQVFINILNNARDELVKKDIIFRLIVISISVQNGVTKIVFQDNAGGIPQKIVPKIFESHFTTKENDGTGIGLYMSKMIVENMNGVIKARNSEFIHNNNKYFGAEFTLEFSSV